MVGLAFSAHEMKIFVPLTHSLHLGDGHISTEQSSEYKESKKGEEHQIIFIEFGCTLIRF